MALPAAVFDTNVFVSALRSRRGASFRLLGLVGTGRFDLQLSVPLALEYESVGLRTLPATDLTPTDFQNILNFVLIPVAGERCSSTGGHSYPTRVMTWCWNWPLRPAGLRW